MSLVLDASATLAWVFERADPNEAAAAQKLLRRMGDEEAILVPELWHLEVLNALVVAQRRGVIGAAKAVDFLNRLDRLPIQTQSGSAAARKREIFGLAREYALSTYDAAYLDLAINTNSALATFDRKLAEAGERAGLAAP